MKSKGSTPIFSLVLIDSGNCIRYDAAVHKDLADRLDCAITHQPMQIGLAASDFQIKALGVTNFQIRFLMNNNSYKVFYITAVVVNKLQDNLNLSINFSTGFRVVERI